MGPESASASTSTPSPPASAKRSRDPEDEVYIDNLHSHKRYLSEIMASSLNGLTVGDPLPENLMESPARSESMFYLGDEMSFQYSPMSEDSDDSRYQRPLGAFSSTPNGSYPSYGCNISSVTCSPSRQRGSDTEGRFPSSPSDICHSADLRRAALLRSVQLRAQPSGPLPFELPFGSVQEPVSDIEVEERPCSFIKSLVDDRDYRVEDCPLAMSEPEFSEGKSSNESNVNNKDDESEG
ncbi:hypothetical protein SLA2020_166070 [Shorea laevis]